MDRVETIAAIPVPERIRPLREGRTAAWKGIAASLVLHLCAGAAAIGALSLREPAFPPVIDLTLAEETSGGGTAAPADGRPGPAGGPAGRAATRAASAVRPETPAIAPPPPSPVPATAPREHPVVPAGAVPPHPPALAAAPPAAAATNPAVAFPLPLPADPAGAGTSGGADAAVPGGSPRSGPYAARSGSFGPAHGFPESSRGGDGAGTGREGSSATAGNRAGRSGADAVPAGFGRIRDAIQRGIVYPAAARRMGWEGTVVVSFRLLADGSVRNVRIAESSGYPALDRGAVDAVRNASPFPRPPAEAEIVTPVVYRLQPAP